MSRTIIDYTDIADCACGCGESAQESEMEQVNFADNTYDFYLPDHVPERDKCSDCAEVLDDCKCVEV
jgi:molybdate-binding protein